MSAYPHHDWNERINVECYRANCASRVLDGYGRITGIINNFKYLNYNVGPTLFQWLEQHDRWTYDRIIQADAESIKSRNGHGNAIAQVYNHVIMPLTSWKDKVTQVNWGIRDFQHRFGRDPKGMWLPETAIDPETAECLVQQGIRFVILSPGQVEKWRVIGESKWHSASTVGINPHVPYLLRTPAGNLTVFFFHPGLSRGVSFGDLLKNSNRLTSAILEISRSSPPDSCFICIATDGECFGHHKAFGDMCLAHFFSHECQEYGIEITNFEEILDSYTPEHEIIVPGKGSSWSCTHGVDRWRKHCGCVTGGERTWTQEWRTPLRKAVHKVSEDTREIFNQVCGDLLTDTNRAIQDYVELILDPSQVNWDNYFRTHQKTRLDTTQKTLVATLLQAYKYSLYCQTSCGWFFADITGLEPVQNLKYVVRTIQLLDQAGIAYDDHETLSILETAKSNKAHVSGRDLVEDIRRSMMLCADQALHHLLSLHGKKKKLPRHQTIDGYRINVSESSINRFENFTMLAGYAQLAIVPGINHYAKYFVHVYQENDSYDSYSMFTTDHGQWLNWKNGLKQVKNLDLFKSPDTLAKEFQTRIFAFYDLPMEERETIIREHFHEMLSSITRQVNEYQGCLLDQALHYHGFGAPLTTEIKGLLQVLFNTTLRETVTGFKGNNPATMVKELRNVILKSKHFDIPINLSPLLAWVETFFLHVSQELDTSSINAAHQKLFSIIPRLQQLGINLNMYSIQNRFYEIFQDLFTSFLENTTTGYEMRNHVFEHMNKIVQLGELLNFNMDDYKDHGSGSRDL